MITIPCLNWMQRVALIGLIAFILQMIFDDKLEGLSLILSVIVIAVLILLVLQSISSQIIHGRESKMLIAISLVSIVIAIVSTTAYFKTTNSMSSQIGMMRMEALNRAVEIDTLERQVEELKLQRFNAGR